MIAVRKRLRVLFLAFAAALIAGIRLKGTDRLSVVVSVMGYKFGRPPLFFI